jgi:hypothetical protein
MAAWTNETTATALALLKVDLGILNSTAYDQRLTAIIDAATSAVIREGVSTLSDSTEDIQMVVMYAEWLWRKRDSGEGMPRNLRWLLNNRIMSEKMQEGS